MGVDPEDDSAAPGACWYADSTGWYAFAATDSESDGDGDGDGDGDEDGDEGGTGTGIGTGTGTGIGIGTGAAAAVAIRRTQLPTGGSLRCAMRCRVSWGVPAELRSCE